MTVITLLVCCEKDASSKTFSAFFELTINGNKQSIHACGTSDFVASYLKDTAVFAGFGCNGQQAGFYLTGHITDGTYYLGDKNQAWYNEGVLQYATDSIHQGTLIIRTKYYQAYAGLVPYIEGEFHSTPLTGIVEKQSEYQMGSMY